MGSGGSKRLGRDRWPPRLRQAAARTLGAGPRYGLWRIALPTIAIVGVLRFNTAPELTFLGDDTWNLSAAADGSVLGRYPGYGVQIFRPLASFGFWLEYRVFGAAPGGYHAASVTLHIINALLVVALASRLLEMFGRARDDQGVVRRDILVGLIAGIVFLLHPSHGEAVYWISAQPDLLATFFSLIAVLALLRATSGSRAWLAVSAGAIGTALLCKESAIGALLGIAVAALVLPLRDRPAVEPGVRYAASRTAPYLLVALGYFALRWTALDTPVGGYGSDAYVGQSLAQFVGHSALSAGRTLLPAMPPVGWIIAGVLAVIAGTGLWVSLRRDVLLRPLLPLLILLIVLAAATLAPVAPLGVSARGPQGERYTYLPSVFTSTLLAALAAAVLHRFRRAALAGGSVVLVLLLGVAIRERSRWADASSAAEAVTGSLGQVQSSPVLLLNVPDTVRGAVAFRNSAAGLDLYGPRFSTLAVRIVTSRDFETPLDIDHVVLTDGGRTARVRVSSPMPSGLTRPSTSDTGPWRVRKIGPTTYEVVFNDSIVPGTLHFFSGGQLRQVK